MIQVDHLTKHYGPLTAVHDVSFSVERGQIVGFLGPNGAGKSTTMKVLACFMPASGGRARVAGFDVFTQSLEVRRRIGYLPENAPLYADLSVAAYLDFVAQIKGLGRARERRARVADVMERCFVTEVQGRLVGKLSKGYRQRVGLAQALLGDPEVLILDEPTIGLDPRQIVEIRALIKELGGKHTVILSTHILPEVSMVCGHVIIINRGRVVAQGTPDQLAQAFPTSRLEVHLQAPVEAAQAALAAVPGALRLDPRPAGAGVAAFVLESVRERDLRGDVVELARARGWKLLELHQANTLEDVFIRVISGEDVTAEAPAGPEPGTPAPAEAAG